MPVSFDVTEQERDLIDQIVNRVLKLRADDDAAPSHARLMFRMDLTACHANGTPLDLEKLRAADDFTLVHDVVGIARHLDRTTGQLTGCFLPRCAALPAGAVVLEGAPA